MYAMQREREWGERKVKVDRSVLLVTEHMASYVKSVQYSE
jgi:hypothetical protein